MRGRPRLLLLIASLTVLPRALVGQDKFSHLDQTIHRGGETQRLVAGKVYTPKGDPVGNASVGIENNAGAPYRVVQTNSQGEFRADYNFYEETEAVKHFTATLQVTKKGFRPARRFVEVPTSVTVSGIPITLRPVQPEDPALLSQADLINLVAPRLWKLTTDDGLPAKDARDYARGVHEFSERKRPERAVPHFRRVAKANPTCLRCRTMLALAELSWGDWDDARRELVECINAFLADRSLGRPEPLLAYGVLLSWEQESEKASAYLAEALKYSPHDFLVLQELGRAQCQDLNWEAGSESLRKALEAGAAPEVRLLYAEALMWAGTTDEAKAELIRYLDGREPRNMPPRVRMLAGRIQDRKKDEAAILAANAKARARGEEAIDYLLHPPQNLPDFEPAADQTALDSILAAVGENVTKLYADLPNISSSENVRQEKLSQQGKPGEAQEHKYRYLCLMLADRWGPSADEYRTDSSGTRSYQGGMAEGFMLTAGFVSGPLLFHPAYQKGSTFRLLGSQKVQGREAFVIAYAQNPARSRLYGTFQDSKNSRPMHKQGLVWIDSETHQIIRLTSDLLRPLSELRLEKVKTEIAFGEVHFNRTENGFWLPNEVTVTLDWNGKAFRNKHQYSEFQLFSVDSTQKLGSLKDMERHTSEPAPLSSPLDDNSLSLVPTTAGKDN